MTTEATKTKTELAQEARRDKALADVQADAKAISKLEKDIEKLKSRIGKRGLVARNNGATLKDIAEVAGYSIGWVQQSLVAAGYEPRDYNRSNGADAA